MLRQFQLLLIAVLVHPSLQNTHYPNDNDTIIVESIAPCHLFGDTDIYGIGIRLSLYIQWFACVVALFSGVSNEIKSARRGINVVSTAVIILTMISTLKGSFAIIEWYIVTSLMVTFPFYFVLPFPSFSKEFAALINADSAQRQSQLRNMTSPNNDELSDQSDIPSVLLRPDKLFDFSIYRNDPMGIGYLLLLLTLTTCLQPWLYFRLLYQGSRTGCPVKVFVFYTSVNLYNPHLMGFLKALAIMGTMGAWVFLSFTIWSFSYGFSKARSGKYAEAEKLIHEEQQNVDVTPKAKRPGPRGFWTIMWKERSTIEKIGVGIATGFALFGFSIIVFVEKTIQINNIDLSSAPLTSTSQLLPLLVGIFSSIAMCWEVYKNYREKKVGDQERDQEVQLQREAQPAMQEVVGAGALQTAQAGGATRVSLDSRRSGHEIV